MLSFVQMPLLEPRKQSVRFPVEKSSADQIHNPRCPAELLSGGRSPTGLPFFNY